MMLLIHQEQPQALHCCLSSRGLHLHWPLTHCHLVLPGIQEAPLLSVVSAKSPGALIGGTGVLVAVLSHASWLAVGKSLGLSESLSSHVQQEKKACLVSVNEHI